MAAAGGLTGGLTGGIGSLLTSGDPKKALRSALLGAGIGSVGAPAAQAVGDSILGEPADGEKNPNTRRGGLGGAAIGAIAGLAGTAALSGKLPLARLGSFGDKAAAAISSMDNPLLLKLKKLLTSDSGLAQAGGLAAGTLAGTAAGTHFGADEGMGLDTIQNELADLKDRRAKRKMLADNS